MLKKAILCLLLLCILPNTELYAKKHKKSKTTKIVKKKEVVETLSAKVLYVIDGDTYDAYVYIDKDIIVKARVRILKIDAPEMSGECDEEIQGANKAKERLAELLPKDSVVSLKGIKNDKYDGRILADTYFQNQNIADILLKEGLVREYKGKKRLGWCEKNLKF